jgi:hypothetical protein
VILPPGPHGQRVLAAWERMAALALAGMDLKWMARPEGFEPPTPRFVVWCSIQLSYGRLAARRGSARAAADT